MAKRIEYSPQDKSRIIELYNLGTVSLEKIGQEIGVSRSAIKTLLIKEGVYVQNKRARKFTGNFNYFETIDTPEKAYWLGFIFADGCVSPKRIGQGGACLKIRLHPKDREHLEKFVSCLEGNFEIKERINSGYSEGQPCIDLEINSHKMVSDLISQGVLPVKSPILKPPSLKPELEMDFIRGYFDGDGSIYKNPQGNNYTVSFVGTKEILIWIQSKLQLNQKLEKRQQEHNNCFYFRVGGTNKPFKLLSKLYNDNICLQRKYNIYQSLQSSIMET